MAESNFVLKDGDKVTTDWGVNRFPDGQVQLWISSRLNIAFGSYALNRSKLSLKCRLTSPEDMCILEQFTTLIPGLPVTILYLYGSRCDKDTQDNRKVYNQHRELAKLLTPSDAVLMPHGVMPNNGIRELVAPDPGLDKYHTVVFPDESAQRRFSKYLPSSTPTVVCSKGRNQLTGEIVEYRVPLSESPKLIGKRVLVVDDICDGGATFKLVADEIRSIVSQLDLYVVHGIFSKPINELIAHGYGHIYTTNSYQNFDYQHPALTVFNVWNL